MAKADLAALIASGVQFVESDTMIGTKLEENGKPFRLEVVIDKPPGDGPFPLLVVNHGSTGRGTNPMLFTETSADRVSATAWPRQVGGGSMTKD